MTNMTGSKLSIFSHSGKITGYWITINIDIYQIDVCGHERRHVTCEFILPIETAILKWQHIHVM
jgi:hypothetical protein